MSILEFIRQSILGTRSRVQVEEPSDELFVYVKLLESIEPLDRGEKYEDPIQKALDARQLGEVSGGGSLLSAPKPDGTRVILYCGIDIDVANLDDALQLLRELLPDLGAPHGSQLQYTRSGVQLQDELGAGGWQIGMASEKSE